MDGILHSKKWKFAFVYVLAQTNLVASVMDASQPDIGLITNESSMMSDFRTLQRQYRLNIPIGDLNKFYDIIGFDAIFNILEERGFCHNKGHNVGRIVYTRNNGSLLESLRICGHRCTNACFHGALMQHMDNTQSAFSYFSTLCDGSGELSKTVVEEYFSVGTCYHAVGHAVMSSSSYDPFAAISSCKSIGDRLKAYFCAHGAFHEYYLGQQGNTAATALLYPCDLTNDFPAACYRTCFLYKTFFRDKGFRPMAEICLAMEDRRQRLG